MTTQDKKDLALTLIRLGGQVRPDFEAQEVRDVLKCAVSECGIEWCADYKRILKARGEQ